MGFLTGRPERRSWTAEPIVPPFPGANTDGSVSVGASLGGALVIPAVWQCVNLIANTISTMPLETFRRSSDLAKRVPDPKIVTSPGPGKTQSEWVHQLMLSLLLRGNAVGRIVEVDRDDQRPTQIALMNPDKVTAVDNGDGTVEWKIGGKDVDPNTIWHLSGLTLPGSTLGVSPITAGALTLGIDLSSRKFAADYFAGGGIPKAVLMSDQEINQQQARTILDRWMQKSSREPKVLGAGVTYQTIQVTPDEAQFLATQQLSIAQIARFFNVPPKMVGGTDGTSMTYANIEQLTLNFLIECIAWWLRRIEDAFFPMLPGAQFVKFNEKSLLRLDAETQAKVNIQYLAGKALAPSEVRNDSLGKPPMTKAQQIESNMVPLTITPLGGAKALPGEKTPPGPEAPVPGADQSQGVGNAP